MQVFRTAGELRAHLHQLRATMLPAASVGFVPTMGALHDGHMSLVRAAREQNDTVVLSIFVNPKQFNDGQDFSSYPRDEAQDLALARESGVDVVFMPDSDEMYPAGFATSVSIDAHLTNVLEGAVRGQSHFSGMATVVTKLLVTVQPEAAYFGAKDFQQVVVVRRFVTDLGLPVRIVSCPTAREPDGLAISSRNVRLSAEERRQAAAIPAALTAIVTAVEAGETDTSVLFEAGAAVLHQQGLDIEYLAFVHPETLQTVTKVMTPTVCAIAVRTPSTRLIDNELLQSPASEGNTNVT